MATPEKKPRKIGRPKGSGVDFAKRKRQQAEIVEWISNGKTLRDYCREPGSPSWGTVYAWMVDDDAFAERFAHARELGEDAIAQECLTIADTPMIGIEEETSDTGKKIKKSDMLGHRKLRIETRMKLLAVWNPKKWGDKLGIGGADGLPPLKSMDDEALDAKIAALTKKHGTE